MRLLLIICLFVGPLSIYAQILNIEKSRLESDSSNYFAGNVTASASLFNRSASEAAPVNLLGFNGSTNLYYRSKKHQYNVIAQVDYLRINENPFLNTGFFHFRSHLFSRKKWSMELYAQHQYDNFRRLNPRILSGANARLLLIRNEQLTIYTGTGFFYEYEHWTNPETGNPTEISLIKSNNYVTLRSKISDSFQLNVVNYYQLGYDPSIRNVRHRINVIFNVLARITQRLSFTFSFNIQYEDKPIVPVTPLIYDFRNGIAFRF